MQAAKDGAYVAALYVPAGQLVHVEEPAIEYLPTPHTMQFAAAVAPVPEKLVPAAQLVHDAAFTSLHVPDGQVMQLLSVA